MKKRIYIDFDGVLNNYNGWKSNSEFFEPKSGVKEFLKKLSQSYEIYIFTARNPRSVEMWLDKYNMLHYVSHITNTKEPAYAYIDDRAIKFDGNYSHLLVDLENFKPYWKK